MQDKRREFPFWEMPPLFKKRQISRKPFMYRHIHRWVPRFARGFKTSRSHANHKILMLSGMSVMGVAGSAYIFSSQPILTDTYAAANLISVLPRMVLPHEVQRHSSFDDCWVVIHGKVYDLTDFLKKHPGGAPQILQYAGKDATSAFSQVHSVDTIARILPPESCLGLLDGVLEVEEEVSGDELQRLDSLTRKPPLSMVFSLSDFEHVAQMVLPKTTYGYYSTGVCDEFSLRENRYAYGRVFFNPRCLTDVSTVDISSTMLGCEVDAPIYITAFAGSRLAHPLGEVNLTNAAFKENIIQMIPYQCSYPFDDFIKFTNRGQEQWFQLHFKDPSEVKDAQKYLQACEDAKCIRGIFINVDLSAAGHKERDFKIRAEMDPLGTLNVFANPDWQYASLTWEMMDEFRKMTDLPIVLKGVQNARDVVLAAEHGFEGVIISNHGGRQLDFARPPLEVLAEARPLLKSKGLEDKIELYIDGGIRRGSDIIKALCLGAKGVGLGRPFLYAMSGYGEEGVVRAIQILKSEMIRDMKLLGVSKISDLNEDYVDLSSLKSRAAVGQTE